MADLKIEDCINKICPWSGEPVRPDGLTVYKGAVVGFCNSECRDKFEMAANMFEGHIQLKEREAEAEE